MAESFDPYYKWLGIPPKDQPPHHYRLLGIELFEHDRDVIDAAANRVMTYLKELSIGDEGQHSQVLLNEVARARICLLNKKQRKLYDRELRARLARLPPFSSDTTPAIAPPTGPPPPISPPPPTSPPLPTAPPPRIPERMSPSSQASKPIPNVRRSIGPPPGASVESQMDPSEFALGRVRRRRASQTSQIGVIAVCLGALGIFILIAALLGISQNGAGKPDPRATSTLVLELDERARSQISQLLLDGASQPLPPRKKYRLIPGQHRLELRRPGYAPIQDSFIVADGDQHIVRFRWKMQAAEDRSR